MKKNISLIAIAIGLIGIYCSCSKKIDMVAPVTSPDGMAYIKVADFATSFRQVVNNRDSFNVYVDGTKINGSFLTYGSIFPSISNLYAAITPGNKAIRITSNGVTTPDSVTLATFNKTFVAGGYYSLIITDSLLNLNSAKQIFVQDNFTHVDTSHYSLRFVHAILNDSAGKNVDVYSLRQAANIFSNVSPGTVTTFSTLNYTFLTDTLIVRRTGVQNELARINGAVLARERAYTLVYKGQPNTTTAPKGRSIITYTNF